MRHRSKICSLSLLIFGLAFGLNSCTDRPMNEEKRKPKHIDWKFLVIIFGIIFNFIISVKIMNNELRHIAKDVAEIKIELQVMNERINKNCYMIERLDERTK